MPPLQLRQSSISPLTSLVSILDGALPDRWQRACGRWRPVATIVALVHLVVSSAGYRPLCRHMRIDLGNIFGTDYLHPSGFLQARQRLSARPGMLDQAFSAVYDHATTARRTRSATYGAFTLIAIDGTDVPLQNTPDLLAHFGTPRNQHGPAAAPHALLSVAWDVGANQPMDVAVGPCSTSERALSRQLLQRLPANALVIADRLYAYRHAIADIITAHRHFLIRTTTGSNAMREVQDFVASGQLDMEVELGCFSHTDPQRYARTDCVRVRLIRGRDADHVYITSLTDRHEHQRETLIELYAKRWRIETAFRELKMWTNITTIRARSHLLVEQEVVACLIYAVLLSELDAMALEAYHDEIQVEEARITRERAATASAAKPHTRKRAAAAPAAKPHTGGKKPLKLRQNIVRFNRAVAMGAIPSILIAAISGNPHELKRVLTMTLEQIWISRTRVNPGRSYPRVSTRPHSKWNRLRQRIVVS